MAHQLHKIKYVRFLMENNASETAMSKILRVPTKENSHSINPNLANIFSKIRETNSISSYTKAERIHCQQTHTTKHIKSSSDRRKMVPHGNRDLDKEMKNTRNSDYMIHSRPEIGYKQWENFSQRRGVFALHRIYQAHSSLCALAFAISPAFCSLISYLKMACSSPPCRNPVSTFFPERDFP